MKKAFKIPLIILGVVVVLLVAANFLAAPMTKKYTEKHDKEWIGREVNIGKIDVNLSQVM